MVSQLANGDQVSVSQGREILTDGCLYIWGKGKRVVWDTQIGDLFCRLPRIPFDVEDLLVHGVVGPRKWLVQPISMMARVLGTKVRGAVVFATFSLYLVPSRS